MLILLILAILATIGIIGGKVLSHLRKQFHNEFYNSPLSREKWDIKHPIKRFVLSSYATELLGLIGWIALIILIIVSLIVTGIWFHTPAHKIEYLVEYEILQYQVDNNIYQTVISDGELSSTYKDIIKYNQNILNGRRYQDNIWIGCFYPNIYNDLPLIELPKESS